MTEERSTASHRSPISELPHLVWDLCEILFRSLENEFRKDQDDYRKYLTDQIEALLGKVPLECLGSAGSEIANKPVFDKVNTVQKAFRETGIDLAVAHFRSRKVQAPQRVVVAPPENLFDGHEVNSDSLFGGWDLRAHAFDKAKENGILLFRFQQEDTTEEDGDEACVLLPREWKLMVDLIKTVREDKASQEPKRLCEEQVKEHILAKLDRQALDRLTEHLKAYRAKHLTQTNVGEPNHTGPAGAVLFVMESCIVTLTLLGKDLEGFKAPRSVLLVPVFVGSERVGGVSFFFGKRLPDNEVRDCLKVFARNLLTYLSVREAQQMEVQKRVLEEMSSVTHLFIHTFNKAFTAPILNISDELSEYACRCGAETTKINPADRLRAIALFLSSFSRRWAGSFAPWSRLSGGYWENEQQTRPRFLKASCAKLDETDLRMHLKALFAICLANDIFDDQSFEGYRTILSSLDGLDRIVTLEMDLPLEIPGNRDAWSLHLLNVMENSLQALPLYEALQGAKDYPDYLTPRFFIKLNAETIDSKPRKSAETRPCVRITVEDDGLGFREEIREAYKKILNDFADPDRTPPTVWDLRGDMQKKPHQYSTKSAESLSMGLIGFADYLSRICRVSWKKGMSDKSGPPHAMDAAEILQRGEMTICDSSVGARIEILVPVDEAEDICSRGDHCEGVYMERRDGKGFAS